ncbi:alpha/beta hydrolase-fold protein [Pseudomonas sp. 7P_10.2_Bac1]|uniref:alpha/beta hydrolase-fold protein n=1 Tax=Pseudomonas sp. 7P_10.2_Bac1 TaxID=2971614 RepID=UPI0021C85AFF|nr:alpha/beta hydrolase-fold protein [Pseudomonas sp. 7P_10.2_Bac1]MCU1726979.1 alpha/beta hydrolase-fold protein [Pseudomonas sp. 7P_10.2_Bac1]
MNPFNRWGLGCLFSVTACASALAVEPLSQGQSVHASVAQAQPPSWSLTLKAGDLVQGKVAGDVSLRLLTAQGYPLRLLIDGADMSRDFMFIADKDGQYLLRVEPLVTRPQAEFSLTLNQVLPLSLQQRSQAPLLSPTLRQLAEQLKQGGSTQAFWKEREQQGTPLVEAIADSPNERLVTFLWRGAQHNVRVFGSPSGGHDALQRLGDSDVWYATYRVPSSARLSYQLAPDVPEAGDRRTLLATSQRDPLNPHRFGNHKYEPNLTRSILELPDAPPQPWLQKRAHVAPGMVARESLSSRILGNTRDVYVYRPAGWKDAGDDQGLLVLFDAHAYMRQVPTPTILDNLIADGLIPPTAALIIANPSDETRPVELPPNPEFARFMAEELMPWAKRQGLNADAAHTVVAGSSYGGLASAWLGLKHPELFGNVLSLSGSFWWSPPNTEDQWLTRQYVTSPRLPLRFYLQAGLFEDKSGSAGAGILDSNRQLRNVLQAKGYPVDHVEYASGHDYLQWRGSLACGLISLIGTSQDTPKACVPVALK